MVLLRFEWHNPVSWKLKLPPRVKCKVLILIWRGEACDLLHSLGREGVCQGVREQSHTIPSEACCTTMKQHYWLFVYCTFYILKFQGLQLCLYLTTVCPPLISANFALNTQFFASKYSPAFNLCTQCIHFHFPP